MDDIDAIESLWKEMAIFYQKIDSYFTINYEAEANHLAYMTGILTDDSKRIFVADDAGFILGYMMTYVKAYPPIYMHKNCGYTGGISVTASASCKGIGKKLLCAGLEWFRKQGLQRVECGVAVENPLSQGFWKGVGFRGFMEKHVLEL